MTNTSIAVNMIRGTYLVGDDATEGSAIDTTVETELLDFDIPAGTVVNGIIVYALIAAKPNNDGTQLYTFRIKVGTNGAEVTRATLLHIPLGVSDDLHPSLFLAVIDDEDWSAAQTVSITGQMDNATGDGDNVYGQNLTIIGF